MTRPWIIAAAVAAVLASAAFAQERSQGAATIPDFSGIWGNPYLYGIEPPASGPGPVVNKARRRQTLDADGRPFATAADAPLVSLAIRLVGDYTNPILNPAAAAVVKKYADMSLSGQGFPSPRNQCWPQGVPFIFTNDAVLLLQQGDRITMLYDEDHEVRRVRMNAQHPAKLTPSWYGDSVGHYEGDTLVIDTVGIQARAVFRRRPVRYAVHRGAACGGTLSADRLRRREGSLGAGRQGERPRRRHRGNLGARPQLQGQGTSSCISPSRTKALHDPLDRDQNLSARIPRLAGKCLRRKPA